ncbi:translocation protein TolB precursor [Pasteurella multocida]|uniref:Translocation protein TolB n=2 Tax=Pasteurella multocida TaxID=747 RepID=A0A1E3XH09_PASMD|nr:translocation protein TolB precursor [Pasteurella multocida]ARA71230.1 translocation protein TolB precursor [Pasteurella multocida subsp. multocida]ARA90221.1 translocation protein TolB precursor [Pasteurella multocida subsp. septica]MBE7395150.1 translocation protein TolB precursor [Pasteurella multocida]MCH1907106.1 translocation protein TolB precursor [Pasteurella multocida]MCL7761719.1 translocation protein TolB precursor [Pasteurella multocida]
MYNLKVRCSMLHRLIGEPKTKADKEAGKITETAKSAVREIVKFDLFGYESFEGNKYTQKGNNLEDQAIKLSGLRRGLPLKKNTERRENDLITGECDVYIPSRRLIIDTKCSWDIGSHPFFIDEAEDKAKKAGYDIQMQGYMWLWDCEEAQIDFILLPTPLDLIKSYENAEKFVDLVEQIPQQKRITTVVVKRDEKVIERIKERIPKAQAYYQQLIQEAM